MFTSRAEHRLLLRIDNADLRLTEPGRSAGLVDNKRWEAYNMRKSIFINNLTSIDAAESSARGDDRVALRTLKGPAGDLVAASARGLFALEVADHPEGLELDIASVATSLRFAGYLRRQELAVARARRLEDLKIPVCFRHDDVAGLSAEVRERLGEVRPETIGRAGRIPGVTSAAVAVIAAHVGHP